MTTTTPREGKQTPMMGQWERCKESAPGALLFFRMGDFYEAFYEDAEVMARELDLNLTKRQEIPMAGVPWHSAEGYIDRLVAKGFRVAIAEQTEDPKLTKKLVNREVVRIVTPGSAVPEKTNNYFVALAQQGAVTGLAILDLSTAEFLVTEFDQEQPLIDEIFRLAPSEILVSEILHARHTSLFKELSATFNPLVNVKEKWHFDQQMAHEQLVGLLKVHSLDGFGLSGMVAAIKAAGSLATFLQNELHLEIGHIHTIRAYQSHNFMAIDRMTKANLELTTPLRDGQTRHTLLGVLDQTSTAMGGRALRRWIAQPLLEPEKIAMRQDAIEALIANPIALTRLNAALGAIRDVERLANRIASGSATPRDLVGLRFSLEELPAIRSALETMSPSLLKTLSERLEQLDGVAALIASNLVDEPPPRLSDGGAIREGANSDLDELRAIKRNGKEWLANYQSRLRNELDIKTLKVGYNRVFGYYLEVSKGQAERMPESYQRRQTLTNAERYISPELKEYETKLFSAEERISSLENRLFANLRDAVANDAERILSTARAVAVIDTLVSLALTARERGYTRPLVDSSERLEIRGGRHPVIEASLTAPFVPNDTSLDRQRQLVLLTGPNMAGKSTYIRQVALITLLAQMGSFVPAESAHIGIVDKLFTRIGASDDLARGQSTFMVEMTETANILNNATDRSLVILDEIGRGTSTYDGVAIAWSVAEYLLTTDGRKARTLFATHYWELTQLENQLEGAHNAHVAVREAEGDVIFLHKIVPGSTDRSYGIHVAKLAGLPLPAIIRAKQILTHLEAGGRGAPKRGKRIKAPAGQQLTLFGDV